MFGLSKEGFKRKKYADIVDSMEARAVNIFGEGINLNNNSFLGMLINVTAWAISLLWELAEKVYFSRFVDYADGNNLDLAVRNIGLSRRAAEKAKGVATFDGTAPKGLLVKINGILFKTLEEGIEVGIEAVEGGISGNISTGAEYEIVAPMPGINEFTATETKGGRNIETDAELRTRFFQSLAVAGAGTKNSIIAALLDTEGVIAANVVEVEEGDYYKGIRPILLGGDNDLVAQSIFNYKAFGIKTIGSQNGIAVADNGDEFIINFDYATEKQIDIDVNVTTDDNFASDGLDIVKQDIETYINSLSMNEDVIYSQVIINASKQPGVIDVDVTLNEEKGNINIGFDEVAVANVVVS